MVNFEPEVDGDEITCHIPSYRVDIEGRADIDEEIVRLIGFDTLKSTLPVMSTTVGQLSPKQKLRRMTRETLKAFGLNEIVTYTLISEEEMKTALSPLGEAIPLANANVRESKVHSCKFIKLCINKCAIQ